jgi:hypothetical protein
MIGEILVPFAAINTSASEVINQGWELKADCKQV